MKYPSYCCQECGEMIGWLGRILHLHKCKKETNKMNDESHLPVDEQDLVYRLRKRAEIRRQIPGRKSVEEGAADRIADLLEEAAWEIEVLRKNISAYYDDK